MKPTSDLLGVAAGLYVDIVVKIMFCIKAGNNYYLLYGTYIYSLGITITSVARIAQ